LLRLLTIQCVKEQKSRWGQWEWPVGAIAEEGDAKEKKIAAKKRKAQSCRKIIPNENKFRQVSPV